MVNARLIFRLEKQGCIYIAEWPSGAPPSLDFIIAKPMCWPCMLKRPVRGKMESKGSFAFQPTLLKSGSRSRARSCQSDVNFLWEQEVHYSRLGLQSSVGLYPVPPLR
ncbi:hypothetical protein AVEN_210566-1 [Araneus ventricosus]|uniref:Uncharacterized protein n=1 Tax=Araneus ventricosus TaxID=182803 RepID=A0A4Y2TE10_ARAVE|nr:hypothetical protein AVEN_210566-1 [Araneus ventricosus]